MSIIKPLEGGEDLRLHVKSINLQIIRHFIISVKGPVFPVIKSGNTNKSTVYYQTTA